MNEQMLKAKKKGILKKKRGESQVVNFCSLFLMHFIVCFHFLETTITQAWNFCKYRMTNALRNQQKSKTFQQVFPLVCNYCLAFKWIKYLQRKSSYFLKENATFCNAGKTRNALRDISRFFFKLIKKFSPQEMGKHDNNLNFFE